MKKISASLVFVLLLTSFSHGFEDNRWEGSSSMVHNSVPSFSNSNRLSDAASGPGYQSDCPGISLYEIEKERKTIDVLKETPTPLRTPDTIVRVLILPYIDNNNVLHSFYYTFLKVEDGDWVLGDYLNSATNKPKKMILHHIDAPVTGEAIRPDRKDDPAGQHPSHTTVTTSRPQDESDEKPEGR